jgi:hypothetical protein
MAEVFRKFPSLAHPAKYGYLYDSSSWKSYAPVDRHMLMFETYGDGLISGECWVTVGTELAADYLLSLAAAMLTDGELAELMTWRFPTPPSLDLIAFAATVRDEPDNYKPRYYSLEFLKVSSSPSKAHDKRWERIERRHDGSGGAIYNMLHRDYVSGLDNFVLADTIRTWMNQKHGYGSMAEPTEFLKWDRCQAADVRHAISVIRSITEAARNLRHAKSYLESYRRELAEKAQPQHPQLTAGG